MKTFLIICAVTMGVLFAAYAGFVWYVYDWILSNVML